MNFAIFEERSHTSKNREGATRRKYYLHPLLSPVYGIPFKRVKEPLYVSVKEALDWVFEHKPIDFRPQKRRRSNGTQGRLFADQLKS